MSSRAEEKERRRQERMAQEQAQARSAANRRRLQLVAGAVLVLALIAAVVVVAAGGGGGDSGPSADKAPSGAKLPPPGENANDLTAAAKAAGCTFKEPKVEGQGHVTDKVTYKSNPPTSGSHNPNPAQDGKYDPGSEPEKEHWVHSLEHGRIITMYRPGTPQKVIDQLSALFDERVNGTPGYHQLLLQNDTKMPYAVAAVAWGKFVGCPNVNDKTFDALRAFRARFVDKAPEFVP